MMQTDKYFPNSKEIVASFVTSTKYALLEDLMYKNLEIFMEDVWIWMRDYYDKNTH